MTYNIHPIIVHFPIALLFVYSVIKILPLQRFMPSVAWHDIKRVLLVLGVAGAFLAAATGGVAEHLVHPNRDLVEAHSLFASISIFIYCALLLGEALGIFTSSTFMSKINSPKFSSFLASLKNLLTNSVLSKILAFLGLVALTITGMLGGVMVYGLSADPLAPIVLNLLGIKI